MAAQRGWGLGGPQQPGICLLWETRFSPVALDRVGDNTIFNPSKLYMNYSNKLKKKKICLIVNVILTDSNIWRLTWGKWGIWHRVSKISEMFQLRQIQPWLQLLATKHQDFLRTAAHLPARDGSSFANEGLAPGANLRKVNRRREHTCYLRTTRKHYLIQIRPTIKIFMIGNPPIDITGWRPLSREAPRKSTQLGHQRRRLPWPP